MDEKADPPTSTDSNSSTITSGQPIDREELLGALDWEISDREAEHGRLGISGWSLLATVVAIFWLTLNQVLENKHDLAQTLLVFLASYCGAHTLKQLLGDGLRSRSSQRRIKRQNRYVSMQFYLIRSGIHPESVKFFAVETGCLLIGSVVLSLNGFPYIGVALSVVFAVGLVVLLVAFIATMIHFPFVENYFRESNRRIGPFALIIDGLLVLLLSNEISKTWATISKDDWRLGLLLTALLMALSLYATQVKPSPDIHPLKSIRSALAFGWLSTSAAKIEVEKVLLGLPKDYRLASKLLELTDVFDEEIELLRRMQALMQETAEIGNAYDTAADKVPVLEKSREGLVVSYRALREIIGGLEQVQKRKGELAKQLGVELRLATTFGNLLPAEERAIKAEVVKNFQRCQEAAAQLKDVSDRYKVAIDKLMVAYGGKLASKLPPLKWKEILSSLIAE